MSKNQEALLLKGNLELILLSILEGGEMYGLEIAKEANGRTAGYFQFKEGSLYPALHRMTEAGWLVAEFKYPPRGGSQVRYYQLSNKGKKVLAEKRESFKKFNRAVEGLWGNV